MGTTGLVTNSTDQIAQNVRAQQQVLELVRSMPYGQSALFRYLNLSTSASGLTNTVKSNLITSGATMNATSISNDIVPARSIANVLAEQNKSTNLVMGSSPKTNIVNGRAVSFRRPNSNCMFQVANRSKVRHLF